LSKSIISVVFTCIAVFKIHRLIKLLKQATINIKPKSFFS